MPRDVEIKARVHDWGAQRSRAALLADGPPTVILQEDTFFHAVGGRLKLRRLSPTNGELIFYQRSDCPGPKTSAYMLVETDRPDRLKAVLEAAYGIRNSIRKTRELYMAGRTRIHLDHIEALGHFLELEVVLGESEDPASGEREARELMKKLGIEATQLVNGAYIDLLEEGEFAREPGR